MSIKSDAGLLWFCFTSLCDWSRKLVSQSQPIKCKTKTKHDLVTRVFPRFKEVACFYSVFSLANNHGNLFSDWQLSSQLDLVFLYSIEKCSTIGSCDQFGFGDPVVINLDLDTRLKFAF